MAMVAWRRVEKAIDQKLAGQEDKKIDKDTRTAEIIICGIMGGTFGMLEYEDEYKKRYLEEISLYTSLSPEEKKGAIDCFIKDLQNPITERGSLYEDFIEYCGTDAKKLRKGVREIVEGLTSYFEVGFGNRDKYVQELLDYAESLNQGQTKSNAQNQDENDILPQIQHMKHLLEIMERSIKGTSTDQDAVELRANAQGWNEDIEKLAEMVGNIDMDAVAN